MNYVLKDIFRQGAENLPCLSIRNKCGMRARKKTDGKQFDNGTNVMQSIYGTIEFPSSRKLQGADSSS